MCKGGHSGTAARARSVSIAARHTPAISIPRAVTTLVSMIGVLNSASVLVRAQGTRVPGSALQIPGSGLGHGRLRAGNQRT
jgi:hypothetical protein